MTASEISTLRDLLKEVQNVEKGLSGLNHIVNTTYGKMNREKNLKEVEQNVAAQQQPSPYQVYVMNFEDQMSDIKKMIGSEELKYRMTTLREAIEDAIPPE
jgi:hypothetical protein